MHLHHWEHDTWLELLPRNHGLTILPYAKLSCYDFNVFIFHGHGLGLEAAVHRYGKGGTALQAVRRRLEMRPPPMVPKMGPKDLFVVGHYSVGVCDLDVRVVGLGEWTGDLNNSMKAGYAVVEPEHPEAPVRLGWRGRQPA